MSTHYTFDDRGNPVPLPPDPPPVNFYDMAPEPARRPKKEPLSLSDTALKAVDLCAWLVREKGEYIGKALNIAANKYKVPRSEVQRGMAARAGRSQAGKKKALRPVRQCQNCYEREAVWHATCTWAFRSTHYYTCAECGQRLPAHDEGGWDAVRWTKYTPSKAAGV